MKRLVILLSLLMLFSFGFANPWSQRYDTWQTFAASSIDVNQTLTFAVEWGNGGWDADGSNLGYGTSTDGTGWTWVAINWVQDGDGTNKRCSTTVTFDTPGTYYYAFRLTQSSIQYYGNGNNGWEETSLTLTDKISTEFFKVTVSEPPPAAISLASFVANAEQGKVKLAWTTATETENDHFNIYRDGVVIAEVAGNGTCTEPHDYSYLDTRVQAGSHSYAIADVSYGGEEVLHDAVNVEVGAALAEASFVLNKAFPNPFNPLTTIDYYMSRGVHLDLGVYNMQGEKVFDLYNGLQEAGTHTAIWDANGFPSGIYFVRMLAGDMVQTMKVVLMK